MPSCTGTRSFTRLPGDHGLWVNLSRCNFRSTTNSRLWGIVGIILAVPLTVIAKIILENIRETKPLATLISNA
jgi:hypothetical protein